MMKQKNSSKNIVCFVLLLLAICFCFDAPAQLVLSGQLRTRTEFRDGVGTLKLKSNDPSFFTSQRTRVTLSYKLKHVVFQTTVQDIRVWGQDASTISSADGNRLGLHEGFAEITLAAKGDSSFNRSPVDYFAIKIGRQEIIYDDSRLLGNLDWLQQARRHDAVVFKLLNKGWQLDLGVAFNQQTDAYNYNGTFYTAANVVPYIKDSKGNLAATPPALIPLSNSLGLSSKTGSPDFVSVPSSNGLTQNYKALQYLYLAKAFHKFKFSWLTLADHFGRYANDSVKNIAGSDTGYIYGKHFNKKGVNSRFTTGLFVTSHLGQSNNYLINAGVYYQTGKDLDERHLNAVTIAASVSFIQKNFSYTLGGDHNSGNSSFSSSSKNHRFDPLYGTPHKFWGGMDYFYVGTGSPAGGFNHLFAKLKYGSNNKRFTTDLEYHFFSLGSNQADINNRPIKKYLGSEIDLVSNYSLNQFVAIEFGCSTMLATSSMEYAKNIAPNTARLKGFWSYLMLIISPSVLLKE